MREPERVSTVAQDMRALCICTLMRGCGGMIVRGVHGFIMRYQPCIVRRKACGMASLLPLLSCSCARLCARMPVRPCVWAQPSTPGLRNILAPPALRAGGSVWER